MFTNEELSQEWNRYPRYKPFIVNFLYAYSFPHRINLKELIDLGVIRDVESVPRGFEKISRSDFEKILQNTKTDDNLIVN